MPLKDEWMDGYMECPHCGGIGYIQKFSTQWCDLCDFYNSSGNMFTGGIPVTLITTDDAGKVWEVPAQWRNLRKVHDADPT